MISKILVGTALIASLTFSVSNSTHAEEKPSAWVEFEIKSELEEIFDNEDIEVIDGDEIPEEAEGNMPELEFDTIEEFKEFVESESEVQQVFESEDLETEVNETVADQELGIASSNRSGREFVCAGSDCTPLYTFPAGPVYVDYTYRGTATTFDSITGISFEDTNTYTSWIESTPPYSNIATNSRSATLTSQGYHLLGISIGGFDAGLRHSKTYSVTVTP